MMRTLVLQECITTSKPNAVMQILWRVHS